MTRWIHILLTMGVISFWVVMNTQLVVREMEFRILDSYQRGVGEYLGNELRRESWMSIYRNNRKIGYTGFSIERIFEDEGVRHVMVIDSRARFDVLGNSFHLDVKGTIVTDFGLVPLTLDMQVGLEGGALNLRGHREGDRFILIGESGSLKLIEKSLPLSQICFGNGLALNLPVAGFEVDQTYEIPVFDPITQSRSVAHMRVKEKVAGRFNGLPVDYFVLETRFLGMTYESWVTSDGETLRQKLPPPLGYTLRREESRVHAMKGFERGN